MYYQHNRENRSAFTNRDLDKCQISVKIKLYKFTILKCLARMVDFGLTPHSYITEDEFGVELRRNRQLIKPDLQKTPQDYNERQTLKIGHEQLKDTQSAMRNTEEHDLTTLRTRSGHISKKPDRLMYK